MPIVAIVGRQNVGKSTLFNRIVGRRKALVSDMPGVTRDRHYDHADWVGVKFVLIDTGGLSFDETDAVESKVHKQSLVALEEADVVICLFDGREGLTALDREVVNIFRKNSKNVVYAANKVDNQGAIGAVYEFGEIGIDPIPISAEHGLNVDVVLDKVIELLPKTPAQPRAEGLRIAVIGRPNVGKSTIINRLAKEERVVAHEMPGTTRDTIDVQVKRGEKSYLFIDTAGVKRRAKTFDKMDKFSTIKSLHAVEEADIVMMIVDSQEGISRQDQILIAYAFDLCKPVAVLVNKWDLMKKTDNQKEYLEDVRFDLKELSDLPILTVSGKTGYMCDKIFDMADKLDGSSRIRVSTAKLNKFFDHLVKTHPHPDYRGKAVKLNYITQVETHPPVFAVFTNQPKQIKSTYKKYLMKGIRGLMSGPMVPIVVKFRAK